MTNQELLSQTNRGKEQTNKEILPIVQNLLGDYQEVLRESPKFKTALAEQYFLGLVSPDTPIILIWPDFAYRIFFSLTEDGQILKIIKFNFSTGGIIGRQDVELILKRGDGIHPPTGTVHFSPVKYISYQPDFKNSPVFTNDQTAVEQTQKFLEQMRIDLGVVISNKA